MTSWIESRTGGSRSAALTDGYKTAGVCRQGHVATDHLELSPELAGKFCKDCGGTILTACPSCRSRIRGHYFISGLLSTRDYHPPNYCEDCGKPFPWMEERLRVASALTDELENVNESDRVRIKESLGEIAKDSPATSLAVIRLKKLLGTATDAIGRALWNAAIDIATEAAKKGLLGH
jgi:hypothetical protein